ncbi:MAG: PorT family protein [Cytophagales bacterium]|nr:PorT family protein [Cytophagales bacterium]
MKRMLFIACLCAGTLATHAQVYFSPQIHGGFTSTYMNDQKLSRTPDSRIREAFGVELGLQVLLSKRFRIHTGLLYDYAVSQADGIDPVVLTPGDPALAGITVSQTYRMNFLSVPVLLAYHASPTKGFYIGAGMNFGMGLGGRAEYLAVAPGLPGNPGVQERIVFDGSEATDDRTHLNAFVPKITVRTGYQFPSGFFAGVYGKFGAGNMSPGGASPIADHYNFASYGVQLGYNLRLSGNRE